MNSIHNFTKAYFDLLLDGWSHIQYAPRDGTIFEVIELGSTGIHECMWDKTAGTFWITTRDDMYPTQNLAVFRLKDT